MVLEERCLRLATGVGVHTKHNEKEARPLIFNHRTVYTGRCHGLLSIGKQWMNAMDLEFQE